VQVKQVSQLSSILLPFLNQASCYLKTTNHHPKIGRPIMRCFVVV
jgi:hypothetical protein